MTFLADESTLGGGGIHSDTVGLKRLPATRHRTSSHCHCETIVKELHVDDGTRILVLWLDCNAFLNYLGSREASRTLVVLFSGVLIE